MTAWQGCFIAEPMTGASRSRDANAIVSSTFRVIQSVANVRRASAIAVIATSPSARLLHNGQNVNAIVQWAREDARAWGA